mmetsp:Transcript_43077/g.49504  ORF Transcript_43077/g.49504 Transcript_43077/m.49504 type:complete len:527 (+) Transcript_43077:250-1830(+)
MTSRKWICHSTTFQQINAIPQIADQILQQVQQEPDDQDPEIHFGIGFDKLLSNLALQESLTIEENKQLEIEKETSSSKTMQRPRKLEKYVCPFCNDQLLTLREGQEYKKEPRGKDKLRFLTFEELKKAPGLLNPLVQILFDGKLEDYQYATLWIMLDVLGSGIIRVGRVASLLEEIDLPHGTACLVPGILRFSETIGALQNTFVNIDASLKSQHFLKQQYYLPLLDPYLRVWQSISPYLIDFGRTGHFLLKPRMFEEREKIGLLWEGFQHYYSPAYIFGRNTPKSPIYSAPLDFYLPPETSSTVSYNHLAVIIRQSGIALMDLGSTNSTWVRIQSKEFILKPSDCFMAGDLLFKVTEAHVNPARHLDGNRKDRFETPRNLSDNEYLQFEMPLASRAYNFRSRQARRPEIVLVIKNQSYANCGLKNFQTVMGEKKNHVSKFTIGRKGCTFNLSKSDLITQHMEVCYLEQVGWVIRPNTQASTRTGIYICLNEYHDFCREEPSLPLCINGGCDLRIGTLIGTITVPNE